MGKGISSNVLLYHVSRKPDHGIAAGCPYQEVMVQIKISKLTYLVKVIPPDSSELMFALNFACEVVTCLIDVFQKPQAGIEKCLGSFFRNGFKP